MSRKNAKSPLGGKVRPYIFWLLAAGSLLIGYKSWPAACLAFLGCVYAAIAMHFGKERLLAFSKGKHGWWVLGLCGLLLVFGPLFVEPAARTYGDAFVKDWEREMNPDKIYYIWSVESSGFEQDQELVKRWNPALEENEVNKTTMLSAAWLLGIEADVLAHFDSTELEPGDTFTLIVFESIRVLKEFPPKDPKKDEPTKRKVSQLRITFITPSSLEKKGKKKSRPKEPTKKVPGAVVASSFNIHVEVISSLDDSVFGVISNGLSKSIDGEGSKVGREDVDKIIERTKAKD